MDYAGRRSGNTRLPARRSQFFRRPIRTRKLSVYFSGPRHGGTDFAVERRDRSPYDQFAWIGRRDIGPPVALRGQGPDSATHDPYSSPAESGFAPRPAHQQPLLPPAPSTTHS